MDQIHPILILLIALNVLFSYKAFKDVGFFNRNAFDVDAILVRRDFGRLISSGFLHVSGLHLGLNMLALYFFADAVLYHVGWTGLLGIYFIALLGGNLMALWFHRNHGDYTAVGASGAVNGIVFSAIIMNPGMQIGLILLPFEITAWIFALLYMGYTLYGIKSQRDNIGHETHLGGAIVGILTALFFYPDALSQNTGVVLACLLPIATFLFLIKMRPEILVLGSAPRAVGNEYSSDQMFRAKKMQENLEIDAILDKIGKKGIESLTKAERKALEDRSKN